MRSPNSLGGRVGCVDGALATLLKGTKLKELNLGLDRFSVEESVMPLRLVLPPRVEFSGNPGPKREGRQSSREGLGGPLTGGIRAVVYSGCCLSEFFE